VRTVVSHLTRRAERNVYLVDWTNTADVPLKPFPPVQIPSVVLLNSHPLTSGFA